MKNWWKETVFYEIYMPSFMDSDGDGTGDFKGIASRLDYLHDLGVNGIWLTPFYRSPKVDNGYDVSDYCSVDPCYGTMKDFDDFIAAAHARGIRVIADTVFNHTSTEHHWFVEASKSKTNKYRDYYIWRDRPNNWESFFSGSAWEFDKTTGQYYYHKFAREQADLNWTNPAVADETLKILKFWIDRGIDGFRFDVINFLTCEGITNDNPADSNGAQIHKYDINQKGIREAIGGLARFIKNCGDKFMVGEIGSDDLDVLKLYQGKGLLDVIFNFNLGSREKFSPKAIFDELVRMQEKLPGIPTLFFSSHDMSRHISRFGEAGRDIERAKAVAALMLTAKGVPFVYFGDEIGMTDLVACSINEINDIQGRTYYMTALGEGKSPEEALRIANSKTRDKSRSPMQWNNRLNAGFSTGKPWLKLNVNFREVNTEREISEDNSLFNFYKKLIGLRKTEPSLCFGEYRNLAFNDGLVSFSRLTGDEEIMVYISFDKAVPIEIPAGDFKVLFGARRDALAKNETLILKKLGT